jgi:hypothetical protein
VGTFRGSSCEAGTAYPKSCEDGILSLRPNFRAR